jgi:hypothetical protein
VGQAGEGGVSRSEEEESEPEYIAGQINREGHALGGGGGERQQEDYAGHALGGGGGERQQEDYAEALRVMVALEQVVTVYLLYWCSCSQCTCFTGALVSTASALWRWNR